MPFGRCVGLLGLLFLLLLSSLTTSAAHAQSCAFQHKLTFADGSVGCLSNYPELASKRIPGFSGTLQDLMPQHGALAVAATVPASHCPLSIGLGRLAGSFTPTALADQNFVVARKDQAIASCESAAGNKPECSCKVIISDGQSLLRKPEFDARFGFGRTGPTKVRDEPPSSAGWQSGLSAQARPDDVARLQLEVDELRKRLKTPPLPAAVAATPPVVPKGKVRALVIGNSAYVSFGRLANPRNDAEAIAQKFRAMGIDVDLALDLDRDSFVRALNQYSLKAVGQDVNILYYAGHGVQVEGVNYLVPTNMSADGVSAGYVKLNGISLNAALDYLPARTRLVFLDACRDNPVSRNMVASRGSGGVGLAPVGAASGTLIAYATKDGATAEDGGGRNSPYTLGLLEHLDKPQDIAVILRQVRQTVMRLTSNRQEPWEYGSLVGEQLILSQIAR